MLAAFAKGTIQTPLADPFVDGLHAELRKICQLDGRENRREARTVSTSKCLMDFVFRELFGSRAHGRLVTTLGLDPSVDERDSAFSRPDPPKKKYRRRMEAIAENSAIKKCG
jgi:hypothetical protein